MSRVPSQPGGFYLEGGQWYAVAAGDRLPLRRRAPLPAVKGEASCRLQRAVTSWSLTITEKASQLFLFSFEACAKPTTSKWRGLLNHRGFKSKCYNSFALLKSNAIARRIHSLPDLALNLSNYTSLLQLAIMKLPCWNISGFFSLLPSYGFLHDELDGVLRRLAGLHHGDFVSIHGDGGNSDGLPSQHRWG